jgi:predicted RNA-binding Zn-ribbon protein involved in translation (DUF1610 family)
MATTKGTNMNSKQARWKCPNCGDGILAPQRPRLDDVRRYCLPCSSKSGKLVERIAPALEAQRTRRKEQRTSMKKKKRQSQRRRIERAENTPRKIAERIYSKQGEYGMNIERETARLWKMLSKMPNTLEGSSTNHRLHQSRPYPPKVQLKVRGWRVGNEGQIYRTGGTLGLAYRGAHLIKVEPKVSWATLAHEIIHIAGYGYHDRAFYMALKWLTETRWKMIVDFSGVTSYGYYVDRIIEQQIDEKVRAEFQKEGE